MDLLILGAGMGMVGGMLPNPLQMIALTQVALGRWARAIFVLIVPPLVVDAAFLFVTLFFFRFIPFGIVHYVAYVGGLVLIGFASHALWELRRKTQEEMANSAAYHVRGCFRCHAGGGGRTGHLDLLGHHCRAHPGGRPGSWLRARGALLSSGAWWDIMGPRSFPRASWPGALVCTRLSNNTSFWLRTSCYC